MSEVSPSPYETASREEPSPASIGKTLAAIGAGYIVMAAAAYGAALTVGSFGTLGLLLVWFVGVAGGRAALYVLNPSRSPIVGGVLGAGCYAATLFVFLYFFRFNMVDGEKGWLESARLLPLFFQQNKMSALIGLIGATMGAMSAYRQTAKRYRYVRVEA